ncbi:bifunctional metallophosphatase/5'-nucleotidase [Bacillus pseudomycoides]|uniref:bifunctional metallophosphatase/5'-nucleotidase n=1 Tax=Bacillus pseudomycoides TaxID=64104 RepID=UPI000BED6C23|nr:5'-nucleotidase C-terminal domain-containing protein [Bacillus pseudomycoides]PDZ10086.1 bifunctional metallophosphatase/5'-nucleotidase [Bacillus pseudomycoides]PEK21986.1 bifunctional metallophosphatase/5'-nucleotidase [Bacillus pseudomycoides]PEK71106.1 bifunctional metallophosphatase/5'-nucleotidase [Bacillus pseudomycoides]PEP40146.1 bifunctional metallophosphatase/5'-nucleotidase [Bacillus pseudomycoides]PEP43452.1 bifunctional metallophosphatase/5'-nucleotidase [Bacillus pseudomycoid
MWKKVIPAALVLSTITFSSVFAAPPSQVPAEQNRYIDVQMLGINDLHGQLDTVKKINNKEAGGAEYLAAYLRDREKQNPNTLMVHAGDIVGASPPVSALLQDEPTIEFLNDLGFDVGTIGNHEFDEGINEMNRLIYGGYHEKTGNFKGANFPYVAANFYNKSTGRLFLPPFTVKMVQGVPVGFIGVVTTDVPNVVMPTMLKNVQITDEVEAINTSVKQLKKLGVKSIVVLAHNGGTTDDNGVTNGDIVRLANETDPEVDVIFGGHSHTYVNGTVNNKLVVQANSYGMAFADVDVKIDRKTKDIIEKKAEVVTTYHEGIEPDQQVKKKMEQYKEKIAPLVNQVVGKSTAPIDRKQNIAGESTLGNLVADAQRATMNAQIALMNPGGIRNDLDAGDITWGELYGIQPFGNQLIKVNLTGQDIRDILNQQWQKSVTRMLQISGIQYTWDANKPDGEKVTNIHLTNGEELVASKTYSVVANAFLASGGDGFVSFKNGKNAETGPNDFEALVDYVKQVKEPIQPIIDGRIQKVN